MGETGAGELRGRSGIENPEVRIYAISKWVDSKYHITLNFALLTICSYIIDKTHKQHNRKGSMLEVSTSCKIILLDNAI